MGLIQNQSSLAKLVQGTLLQLIEYRYRETWSEPIEEEYLYGLIYYLKGESRRLEAYIHELADSPIREFLVLRLKTLNVTVSEEQIDLFLQNFSQSKLAKNKIWQAECFFVAAQAYASRDINEKAADLYKKAHVWFNQERCFSKSIKSLLNHLATVSRFDKETSLISDYYFLAKKAKFYKEPIVVGVSFLNISREYQLLGATETALDYINQSLEYLESDYGSKHYYLALAHRAHLLIELKRYMEAKKDYDQLIASQHPAVAESIKILDELMGDKQEFDKSKLSTSWRERLQEIELEKAKTKLTQYESKLIELLVEKPRKKEDLVSLLYGEQVDYLSANNRFKVLLSRLRKKRPNMIVSNAGCYKISDQLSGQKLERELYA